jgi:small-conductance mechanosensitive channel
MSLKNLRMNKDEFYKTILFLSNTLLALAALLIVLYLIAPLLGGKLSVYAIIAYASWIGIALVSKLFVRRARKGLRIRAYEYIIACLYVIFNLLFWFRYPVGIILSILSIVGLFFAYRAQDRRQLH